MVTTSSFVAPGCTSETKNVADYVIDCNISTSTRRHDRSLREENTGAVEYLRLKLLRLGSLHIVGCAMTADLPVDVRGENAPSRND